MFYVRVEVYIDGKLVAKAVSRGNIRVEPGRIEYLTLNLLLGAAGLIKYLARSILGEHHDI